MYASIGPDYAPFFLYRFSGLVGFRHSLHNPRPIIWMKSSDGTAKNQMGKDEGPLTLKRSETIDEEIRDRVVDFLERNKPVDMPTLIERTLVQGKTSVVFPLREYWIDVGRLDDLQRASDEF